MTGAPIRDPLADHLLTPENAAFLFIDYQPSQLAAVRSMNHDLLLKNAVSTVRTIKTFGDGRVPGPGQAVSKPERIAELDDSGFIVPTVDDDAGLLRVSVWCGSADPDAGPPGLCPQNYV